MKSNEMNHRHGCAAVLASLPGMGPIRLSALLADRPPEAAWEMLRSGAALPEQVRAVCGSRWSELGDVWHRTVAASKPDVLFARYNSLGIGIWTLFDDYPDVLRDDFAAPGVLFYQGVPSALNRPSVAIIGTRRCTYEGKEVARRMGLELSEAGICVVSGLALGIDAAAHRGAVEAGGAAPVAVVGSGLDRVYPSRNRKLWEDVRDRGLIISEAHLGAAPEAWRFPARNRLIAALADVVVVVESHERGGSMHTVDEAADRSCTVMAVPGSIRNPAARGTNALIADGCAPACSTEDVLAALAFRYAVQGEVPVKQVLLQEAEGLDAEVLEAVGWDPTPVEEVMVRTGFGVGEVAASLLRLEQMGRIAGSQGWWARIDAPTH